MTVVTARMNRSGHGIRRRMGRKKQRVHLAEQGHNRSLPPCIHVRTESRYGKTAFHGQSEFLQFFRRSSGGPDFAISEFRMFPDLRSEIKHFLTMPVNFPADLKFEFLQIHLFRFPFL